MMLTPPTPTPRQRPGREGYRGLRGCGLGTGSLIARSLLMCCNSRSFIDTRGFCARHHMKNDSRSSSGNAMLIRTSASFSAMNKTYQSGNGLTNPVNDGMMYPLTVYLGCNLCVG